MIPDIYRNYLILQKRNSSISLLYFTIGVVTNFEIDSDVVDEFASTFSRSLKMEGA